MTTRFANQKNVTINKPKLPKSGYGTIDWKVIGKAAQELNGAETLLYIYLISNKDGFNINLSQKAVEEFTGIAARTYHRAVNKLIEKGYLVQPDPTVNNWVFYSTPQNNAATNQEETEQKQEETEQEETEQKQEETETPQFAAIDYTDLLDDMEPQEILSSYYDLYEIEKENNPYRNWELLDAQKQLLSDKLFELQAAGLLD